MMVSSVASIAVRVRPLVPEDSLARAAEAVRLSPGGVAPVQIGGSLIGIVSTGDLTEWIAAAGIDAARQATVGQVMRPALFPLRGDATVPEALERLRAVNVTAAPVIDGFGRYQGMVGRGELL